MRYTLLAACVAALAPAAVAADPKGPPVDTSFVKRHAQTRGFMLGRPAKPKVTPDGKTVLFLRAEATVPKQKLFAFDVATGQTTELLSPEMLLKGAEENLSPEEKARRERQRVTVGGFADYHLDPSGNRVLVMLSGKPYVFDRTTKKANELAAGAGTIVDPKWSPDGKWVSYVRDHDVYAYDLSTDKEHAVTTGGTATKTHGLAEFVAQEEMDRHTGYWWSPDSKFIAYEEADHAGVETWYIADPLKPDVKPAEQFYPRPGKKNVSVRLGVKPVAGGETVWVNWDRAKYEYLARVDWEWGGLTVLVQGRRQQEQVLLKADPKTGATTQLLAEKDPAWLNLAGDGPHWSGGLAGFVWLANGPDGPEVQTRDTIGKPSGRLLDVPVPASEYPADVIAVGERRAEVHIAYHATPDPTQKQVRLARVQARLVDPGSEKAGHLTTEPGQHTAVFGKHLNGHVVTSTTLKEMPRSVAFKTDRTRAGELPSVAEEPGLAPNVTVQQVGDYWTAVVRPRDFDPKKKYPVVVDVYGGPHHLHVVRAMRNWLLPQWLADQGFVVVAVDNRGTPGRGRDWERAVYQKFGTVPLEDQAKCLRLLGEKLPELDLTRVGIVGWSFGGYMAANAVLRKPDVFHAAVAGAPVTDWEDYDTHYTERYLGLLPESKAAYDEASLLPLAKDLMRPLLLVHGTADDNVYYRHTLKLSDALFRAGRPFEVLPLPGVTHLITADPVAFERYWGTAAGFFRQHLGGPK
jgi:dipeptidyl-peptidase-4